MRPMCARWRAGLASLATVGVLAGAGVTAFGQISTAPLFSSAAVVDESPFARDVVTGPDASDSPLNTPIVVPVSDNASEVVPPFGFLDTPLDNATGVTGAVPITGWALDDMGVEEVTICRAAVIGETAPVDARCAGATQIFIGTAVFIEGARPDVNAAFPAFPQSHRAGWGFMMLTNMLPDVARGLPTGGNGTYAFFAYARDVEGQFVLLGTRTMTCDNEHATLPFGTIDTPGQGGVVSGSEYVNFGWILTPRPKFIPFDGSTIEGFVDGASIGSPSYNHFRPDIAGFFPGLANSNGAVGFIILKPRTLSKGLHTIAWVGIDSNGAVAGIGSRFFRVRDETNRPPVAHAGFDQTVTPGATVHLDGSGSSDPDSDALTYSWSLLSKPPGSSAVLSGPTSVNPTFVADVPGGYSARLIVNDGQDNSAPATVTIDAGSTLGCGALISGQIVAAGEVDQVTFSGSAGQRVTLTLAMSGFPSFVAARAMVFSPTANMVATFDANSQRQLTLPETGTYVVQVRASNLVSTGSYTLGRECLLPTSPVDATLACGGLVARTIVAPAQVDQITFVAQANDRVTLTLAMSSFPSFVAARATVFSPTGGIVVDVRRQQSAATHAAGNGHLCGAGVRQQPRQHRLVHARPRMPVTHECRGCDARLRRAGRAHDRDPRPGRPNHLRGTGQRPGDADARDERLPVVRRGPRDGVLAEGRHRRHVRRQ